MKDKKLNNNESYKYKYIDFVGYLIFAYDLSITKKSAFLYNC